MMSAVQSISTIMVSILMVSLALLTINSNGSFAAVGPSANPVLASSWHINQIANEVNVMRNRWQLLDSTCSPNAVFSLTYLYMTTALLDTVSRGYFDDNGLMSNFTINFASRYNLAIESYLSGQTSLIPLPWQEAFNYGASGYSSVQEDLVLGMNAHINYDLSGVVYDLNYGYSQYKNDYDRINDILTNMTESVTSDLGSRYDATLLNPLYGALNPVILALLTSWRQGAWSNAVLQLNALTPIIRASLRATVITEAMAIAHTQESYNLGISTRETRLAYCEANHAPSRL